MISVLESLNSSLLQALADDVRVYLLGEDILDPYGGAFKVTRGLSTIYPGRVITTPISEAGIVGVAAGMALRGLRPVVEIMFGDFTSLVADQVINHASKFRWMYNEQVCVPMVIRTPMGGRRGYGPTHSQSLEKLFLGIPGITVIAPAAYCANDGSGSPGDLLYQSILERDEPTIFIENKLQYYLPVQNLNEVGEFILDLAQAGSRTDPPTYSLKLKGTPPPTLTIAAYGYMSELARQAALRLAYEQEIFAQIVIPTQLAPFNIDAILHTACQTGALLVVEEGTLTLGWGAEIIARIADKSTGIKMKRIAARDLPIPVSAPLEAQVLPGVEEITRAAIEMMAGISVR